MNHSTLTFLWQDPQIARGYRTGVSLHGHTLHSKECLSFLPRYLCRVPGVSHMVRRHQRRFLRPRGIAHDRFVGAPARR